MLFYAYLCTRKETVMAQCQRTSLQQLSHML